MIMKRRTFVNRTALCAVAVSASGFIRYDGKRYVGDCETTTDILGPFYRPGSPVRNSLVVDGAAADIIELSGVVYHKDCVTPYKNAKVELWHCSGEGIYDNDSDKYLYRGTAFSDKDGNYIFTTNLPVPYDIGAGSFRPAHFHMMITAEGYVPLVTQLYFAGDPHLMEDSSSSSPLAKRRILEVEQLRGGNKKVIFNVGMSEVLLVQPEALDKLTGTYTDERDSANKVEFFSDKKQLWMKNEVYGMSLDYAGSNTFSFGGTPGDQSVSFTFEIMKKGSVKLTLAYPDDKGALTKEVYLKKK
jgi:catechol 1,2-dioxygenase